MCWSARPELGTDNFLHLGEAERLDFVLQTRQRLEVGLGKELHPGREKLSELDKSGPEFFEIIRQLVRFGGFLRGDALFRGEGLGQPGGPDQIGPPILHEDPGDLPVAVEVLWFKGDAHGMLAVVLNLALSET